MVTSAAEVSARAVPRPAAVNLALLWLFLAGTLGALLFAGTSYTKLEVAGPITAYDLSLLILALLSLGFRKAIVTHRYFLLLLGICLAYAAISIGSVGFGFNLVRQFAFVLYAVIAALIVSRFLDAGDEDDLLLLLRRVAYLSIAAQLALGAILLAQGAQFGEEQYHYLSPAAIVLNLCALGWFLSSSSWVVRIGGTVAALVCLAMTGHSTALLAAAAQIALLVARVLPRRVALSVGLLSLLAVPIIILALVRTNSESFDANAMWRFFYWAAVGQQIVVEKFGVLGHGFGVPYASEEVAYLLQVVQGYTTNLGDGDESFYSTPHNFFLTLAFHIGLLPSLILLVVVWRCIARLCLSARSSPLSSQAGYAMGSGLLGICIWSAFNVVVELPHASLVFWLTFFLACSSAFAIQRRNTT
jgi:hypothetical protein